MPKPSHREKILTEGLQLVHARGFANASVRDIVQAAGVPQGSFTNHFASKEAFGLEVIELYRANSQVTIGETLRNDARAPLERLGAYLDATKARLARHEMRNGCLFGNFTAEASDHSERIRLRLVEIFAEVEAALAYCLRAAVAAGEVRRDLDSEETAAFIVASMQGANLLAKAQRSAAPIERFRRILLGVVLAK